jgi:tripartite-type tricarboxylate transporter receptor subunit TctC
MGALSKTLSFVAFIAAITPAVSAADADKAWPERTVRIVTTSAGSSPDAVARTLADAFTKRWKQSVIVENRAGAGGIIAVKGFLEAQDGHTLLLARQDVLTVNPLLTEPFPTIPSAISHRSHSPLTISCAWQRHPRSASTRSASW